MRFLVLGASGMAGHTISLYLSEQGHDVTGFAMSEIPFVKSIVGDARNVDFLTKIIGGDGYDVVVNAVGVLNKAAEDNEVAAAYLNGELPHLLAGLTKDLPTRVFHMSTDCVFAGNTGPYTEDSVPDGKTVYDRTKAAGELRDGKNLTFRNSIVGPDMNPGGIGLLNWFMRQDGPIRGFTGAIWTGLTTLELAKAMETAALEGSAGLVNMVPGEGISKYRLLGLFNRHFKGGAVEIEPCDGLKLDKALTRTNFDCSFMPKSYEEQVAELAEWTAAHASLYPHYELGGLQ